MRVKDTASCKPRIQARVMTFVSAMGGLSESRTCQVDLWAEEVGGVPDIGFLFDALFDRSVLR
jgi:hypothetical protein